MPAPPRRFLGILPICLALASCLFDSDDESSATGTILDPHHATEIPLSFSYRVLQLDPSTSNRFRFVAREGESYRIQTWGSEVSIHLHGPDGTELPVTKKAAHGLLAIETAPLHAGIHYLVLDGIGLPYCSQFHCIIGLRLAPLRGGIPVDDFEPDNQLSEAKHLVPTPDVVSDWRDRMERTLHPSDTDWVKIASDSGWHYTIATHGAPTRIELFDAEGMPLDTASPPDLHSSTTLSLNCRRTGTYALRITTAGPPENTGLDSGTYFLRIEKNSIPPSSDWVRDDDNTIDSASPLSVSDEWRSARIDHPTDLDWYRFTAQSQRTYSFEAVGDGSGVALHAQLRASPPDGNPAWADSSIHRGDTTRIDWLCPADGEYFIQVRAVDPTAAGAYRIALRSPAIVTTPFDAYEPDDRVDLVHSTPTDGAVQNRSFHKGDFDVIRFSVDPGRLYAIDIDGLGDARWDSLAISFGSSYSTWSWMADSAGHPGGIRILFASCSHFGQVVLELSAAKILRAFDWSTPGATAPYHLSIQKLPDSQNAVLAAHEPDDGLSMARSIGSDYAEQEGMLVGTDPDWLRFPAMAGKTYAIEVRGTEGIRAELFEAVQLWNDVRSAFDSTLPLSPPVFTSGPVTRFTWTSPRTFDAFLRLTSVQWNRIGRYTISVEEIAPASVPAVTPPPAQ